MRFVPVAAILTAGLALYVSGGVLDQLFTPDGLVRVAMLPPWAALVGFLGLGGLGLLWLDRRAVPRGTATPIRPPLGPLLLPLLGLLVLVLPYLPVLPDLFPPLQMLAGPVRGVIWMVVLAQWIWTLGQARIVRADWLQRATATRLTLAVGLATATLGGAAAIRFTETVLYPAGDEPHYLVIAQSLWRDGDLKIENNHTRGDYREYFPRELEPHYLTRGADEEIYSIHPIGMPVLMTPIYAAGGYRAVVVAFVLMAAVAAALMWRTTLHATNELGATTFGWAAVVATSPFLFNAFAIYPEIPAALAVAAGFSMLSSSPTRLWSWVAVGLCCAALPWLSTKYAPMSAALVLVAAARVLAPGRPGAPGAPGALGALGAGAPGAHGVAGAAGAMTRLRPLAAIGVPYAVSLALWFSFFYWIWGVPLPQAPYGALVQTSPWNLVFGAPGLLFDQEYGLLPYAPVYILAVTGLWVMWRTDRSSRRQAVEVVLVFGALLATVGAFRIWWGGSASPGRPLTSGLLLLAIPVAYAFRAAPMASAQRAAQHLLLWASIGVTGILFFAQQGLLTANGRDGTSSLLEYVSPRWPAWTLAPTFIHHEAPTAIFHTVVWLALAGCAAFVLSRVRTALSGTASLAAIVIAAASLLVAMVVIPLLPLTPAWPELDVRARARLPFIDEYDTVARPVGIVYAPLRFASPAQLVAFASVAAERGVRTDPQPIRVLHNGRFSLPAGSYRVEVDWNGRRSGETLGLQIGRTGDAWQEWTVNAQPGEQWSAEFSLPLDASFVGLRGSPEVERVIERVRFVPLSVMDKSQRPKGPTVIAASRSGPAAVFYYDINVSPEETGFWVWGNRRTRVAIARPLTAAPLVLRVHSGPIENRLHLTTFGWRQTVTLQPHSPVDVEVPAAPGGLFTLDFAADLAFVPGDLDASSSDTRGLGVWVEVVQ
jgi:hypothetical protein